MQESAKTSTINGLNGDVPGGRQDRRGPASACAGCALRPTTFCAALAEPDLLHLGAIVHKAHFNPGQLLFQEGDAAPDVFNLLAGTVKLYKGLADGRTQVTGFAQAGDFIGLAGGSGYCYSAEAVSEVTVCRFHRRELIGLCHEFPVLMERLLAITDEQLAVAHEQMLLLGRKTAEERIVTFLLGLARRAARRGERAETLRVPVTRTDIADYLGLTIETVSRILTRLRKRGVIRLPNPRAIVIAKPADLARLADGAS